MPPRYQDAFGGQGSVGSVGSDGTQPQRRFRRACVATHEPYVALCERLVALFPHGDATKVVLLNSGAEAVENAIKIARQATGRPAVVCFTGSFHGRTLLGMSLTSKVGYKAGCGPFAPEIYRLPFPSYFHHGAGRESFARGWGTLYTTMYEPHSRGMALHWAGLLLQQSIDSFQEGAVTLSFGTSSGGAGRHA